MVVRGRVTWPRLDDNGFIYAWTAQERLHQVVRLPESAASRSRLAYWSCQKLWLPAVVGVPDLQRGEAIVAFVTLRDGQPQTQRCLGALRRPPGSPHAA